MMVQNGNMLISRYFNKNVQIVAGMCARCYEECDEIQIVAVNIKFLLSFLNMSVDRYYESSKHQKEPSHVEDNKINETDDITFKINEAWDFTGFTKNEIDNAKVYVNNFAKVSKFINYDPVHPVNISKYFCGFIQDNIDNSLNCNNKYIETNGSIRFKIYQRTSNSHNETKSLLKNKISLGDSKNKTVSRKPSIDLNSNPIGSKYFSMVNNNSKLKFTVKKMNIKMEIPDNNTNDFKIEPNSRIDNFKDEPPPEDFEIEYFKMLQDNPVTRLELQDKKFPNWIPPKSPHNLIEESLYHDPWALLVATIFLNRTKCMIARPYVFWFLKENPDPLSVLEKYPQDLEKYFLQLGLQKTRAGQVWKMSNDYVHKKWKNVKELYGIGVYGETAFRMFCLGDFSLKPKDRFLRIYKAWYENIGSKLKDTSEYF